MATKAQHDYAVYLFNQGFYGDTVKQLDEVLREEETGERWSDWATAQFGLNQFAEAERGFRRALELNPELLEAAVNFGVMLTSQSRWAEAVELFERALPRLEAEGRGIVNGLLEQCRAQLAVAVKPAPERKRRKEFRRARAKR
jgi:tetratricopeptide (TPR) repeat protein